MSLIKVNMPVIKLTPAQEYEQASIPNYIDLINTFKVKILSGPFKFYKTHKWIKQIESYPVVGTIGYNEIAEFETDQLEVQGHFIVGWTSEYAVLDYNVPENKKSPWLRMKDHVRATKFPGEYIGKIYIKVGWVYWPAGYFSLSRIQGGCNATRK